MLLRDVLVFLKIGWAILKNLSFYPIKTHNKIIMTSCLPHKLIRMEMPCDPFEEAFDDVNEVESLRDSTITSIETSEEWNTWRTHLAQEMYHQWRASRQST